MTSINATEYEFAGLNELVHNAQDDVAIVNCCGQRFIAAGMKRGRVTIDGVPGNALGAYLTGGEIIVHGNAQDAVGDTMNDGEIVISGNVGDAVGYAMRGGAIYVRGNAGYRAGIHMKEYKSKKPVIVIGGRCGSFLGEYQAGGRLIVLGLHQDGRPSVGNFPCTGMHGGKLILRGDGSGVKFPVQTKVSELTAEDWEEIAPYLHRFCEVFGVDYQALSQERFCVVTPDSQNPYKQMYVAN
ncbi:MAG: glutamate synthase [Planctomycetia bacterium]|nr:glutamate synthase [Planctomycetia bacterium]